jgi:hypothetical protein
MVATTRGSRTRADTVVQNSDALVEVGTAEEIPGKSWETLALHFVVRVVVAEEDTDDRHRWKKQCLLQSERRSLPQQQPLKRKQLHDLSFEPRNTEA